MNTLTRFKKVTDLVAGDRVLMEGGDVRVVAKVGKGFANYRTADGKIEPSVMIDWKDGEWSQMARSDFATLVSAKGKVKS